MCTISMSHLWSYLILKRFSNESWLLLLDIEICTFFQCVKFLWNLFNSDNVLFSRIIRYSMHNSDTTIGENVRYFMYKYKIVYDDWFNDLSNIFNTIDSHIQNTTQLDAVCLAGAIRELCESRDSGIVQFVDRNQICNMIDLLCTR